MDLLSDMSPCFNLTTSAGRIPVFAIRIQTNQYWALLNRGALITAHLRSSGTFELLLCPVAFAHDMNSLESPSSDGCKSMLFSIFLVKAKSLDTVLYWVSVNRPLLLCAGNLWTPFRFSRCEGNTGTLANRFWWNPALKNICRRFLSSLSVVREIESFDGFQLESVLSMPFWILHLKYSSMSEVFHLDKSLPFIYSDQ